MTTSNLTNRERECLRLLPTVEPKWGMAIEIGKKMITKSGHSVQPNNIQLYLTRLCKMGYVKKISRGIYGVS